jgi:bud site selection protein 20
MGRLRRSRVHNARRDVHRAARTRVSVCIYTFQLFLTNNQVRTRDLDQIQLIDLDPKVRAFIQVSSINLCSFVEIL